MTQKNNKIQRCKQTTNKHTNIHKANNVITTRKDFLKLYDLIENYIFNSLLIISAPNRSLFLLRLAIAINSDYNESYYPVNKLLFFIFFTVESTHPYA